MREAVKDPPSIKLTIAFAEDGSSLINLLMNVARSLSVIGDLSRVGIVCVVTSASEAKQEKVLFLDAIVGNV